MTRPGGPSLRLVALVATLSLGLTAAPVFGAVGDRLENVSLPGNNGTSVSGTFTGTYYITDVVFTTTIDIYLPPACPADPNALTPATLVCSKTLVNAATNTPFDLFGTVAWDASRNKLWGAGNNAVWLIDIGDPTNCAQPALATFQFNPNVGGLSLVDGLAWDANTDRLWYSPDVNLNVYEFSLGAGADPALGTLISTLTPLNAAGQADGSISGVVVGSANSLYVGRNGFAEIRRVDKTTGNFISNFATTAGRVEDLTCDPLSCAPNEMILAKDAFNGNYEGFEVEAGTCPLAEACDPDPKTQGYWHRQCLGLSASDPVCPGIDPGRNGRGPQSPTEPNFCPDLHDCAAEGLEDAGMFGVLTCEGMDADPPSDKCEKALKQLTALILNVCSGRLQNSCEVDTACESTSVGELINEIADLINSGDCNLAAQCAGAVNEGDAIVSNGGGSQPADEIDIVGPGPTELGEPIDRTKRRDRRGEIDRSPRRR